MKPWTERFDLAPKDLSSERGFFVHSLEVIFRWVSSQSIGIDYRLGIGSHAADSWPEHEEGM